MSPMTKTGRTWHATRSYPVDLIRLEGGFYRTPDGEWAICRTEWEGPKGGRQYVWEILQRDPYHEWVGIGGLPWTTLRDAKQALASKMVAA